MAVMIADGNVFFARDRLLGTCLPFRLFVCFDFYFTSVGDECCWLACGRLASRLLNPHVPYMLACFSAGAFATLICSAKRQRVATSSHSRLVLVVKEL